MEELEIDEELGMLEDELFGMEELLNQYDL